MANQIRNHKAELEPIRNSNILMAVLMGVITISASDAAETLWEKRFAVWISQHDQNIYGIGTVGFDIDEMPWTVSEFDKQKTFVLKAIDLALGHHRWDVLSYTPGEHVDGRLQMLRQSIEAFRSEFVEVPSASEIYGEITFEKYPKHDVYLHAYGCILCNDDGEGPGLYHKE